MLLHRDWISQEHVGMFFCSNLLLCWLLLFSWTQAQFRSPWMLTLCRMGRAWTTQRFSLRRCTFSMTPISCLGRVLFWVQTSPHRISTTPKCSAHSYFNKGRREVDNLVTVMNLVWLGTTSLVIEFKLVQFGFGDRNRSHLLWIMGKYISPWHFNFASIFKVLLEKFFFFFIFIKC